MDNITTISMENLNLETDQDTHEKAHSVLSATLVLIASQGLHNTPMSKVGKIAGVSVGTIYHYFEDKESLIRRLYVVVTRQCYQSIIKKLNMPALEKSLETPEGLILFKQEFDECWRNLFTFLCEHPAHFSFIQQCSISPIITLECTKQAEQHALPLTKFLEIGKAQGYLKNFDTRTIAFQIYANINSIMRLRLLHGDIEQWQLEDVLTMCWDAVSQQPTE